MQPARPSRTSERARQAGPFKIALPRVNGFRNPPAHLPAEQQQSMRSEVRRRLEWAGKCRGRYRNAQLALQFVTWASVVPAILLSNLLSRSTTQLSLCVAGELVVTLAVAIPLRRMMRPTVLAIVSDVWWENNVCPACNFDVRATPGCCPECGARRPNSDA